MKKEQVLPVLLWCFYRGGLFLARKTRHDDENERDVESQKKTTRQRARAQRNQREGLNQNNSTNAAVSLALETLFNIFDQVAR